MKNKVFYKFLTAFAAIILLFSLAMGSVFFFLFRSYTVSVNRESMERRASSIAESLSEAARGKHSGYGAYLKHLNELAMAEVWIVDSRMEVYMPGCGDAGFGYSELPENAGQVIRQVFAGETIYGEQFSDSLGISSLTVGAPIYSDEKVVGAVLLHSPVSGIDNAVRQGLTALLLGCGVGILLALAAAAILSGRMTRPLKAMNETALQLAEGNYKAHTGVDGEDELGKLAESLDILAQRLEDAKRQQENIDKMRDSFVANVSHELRTPLAILRGYIELLSEGTVTNEESIKEYYRQMLSESRHMERLVNDLLELSRLQDAGFRLSLERVELGQIVSDAARAIRREAQKKNIQIETALPDKECPIDGDYGRVRQLLIILLDNAVKFSPEGETVRISVDAEPGPVLRVTDHGAGIPEEQLPYIFERFNKSDAPINQKGAGLGLAIAKEIVRRHNADIHASSGEGGTEFTVTFPDCRKSGN